MSSTHKTIRYLDGARAQRGVVLVVALIFLLLLSIIAVAASSRSLLQERMAGGLLNAQRAQMSAQTALRGAEWKLFSSAATVGSSFVCVPSNACYTYVAGNPDLDVVNFRTKPGRVTVGSQEYRGSKNDIDFTAAENGKLADNPRFIIEYMGKVSSGPKEDSDGGVDPDMYRITARATGGDKNTVTVLESTFEVLTTP